MAKVAALQAGYQAHTYLIAVQGLTPIPFKLVTISAALQDQLRQVHPVRRLARSVRFIVIEGLIVHFFGDQAKAVLDKYMEIALWYS